MLKFLLLWYCEEVKPAVKTIKARQNLYAALSIAFILLTVLFIITKKTEVAIACGGLTAVSLILLYRQSRLLGAAMVIYDSRIMTVLRISSGLMLLIALA